MADWSLLVDMKAIAVQAASATGAPAPDRLDPAQLILQASIPVKAVLLVLVLFSVACWFVIGARAMRFGTSRPERKVSGAKSGEDMVLP